MGGGTRIQYLYLRASAAAMPRRSGAREAPPDRPPFGLSGGMPRARGPRAPRAWAGPRARRCDPGMHDMAWHGMAWHGACSRGRCDSIFGSMRCTARARYAWSDRIAYPEYVTKAETLGALSNISSRWGRFLSCMYPPVVGRMLAPKSENGIEPRKNGRFR